MARTEQTRRITSTEAYYLQRMGRSHSSNGGYSCNRRKARIHVVAERTSLAVQSWKLCSEGELTEGKKSQRWCYQMYQQRARRESIMLLLKVPVTSIEGVDDSTSYTVVTSKEEVNDANIKVPVTSMEGDDEGTSYAVATSKEGVNDAATKGSGDKHGR
ncbi:uncharacterized protein G2W53_041490 [Senna tora]|uniref:Uncharacterized protein n=1 Tax=Senna tora TaxID=362788 RepID=A0A834SS78_9FABA|nr:uncharacterized protein G2W53_041490 [Senna tora]